MCPTRNMAKSMTWTKFGQVRPRICLSGRAWPRSCNGNEGSSIESALVRERTRPTRFQAGKSWYNFHNLPIISPPAVWKGFATASITQTKSNTPDTSTHINVTEDTWKTASPSSRPSSTSPVGAKFRSSNQAGNNVECPLYDDIRTSGSLAHLLSLCNRDLTAEDIAQVYHRVKQLVRFESQGSKAKNDAKQILWALKYFVIAKINDFQARHVNMLLGAHAVCGLQLDIELERATTARIIAVSSRLQAQHIANMMWAYATLRANPDAELLNMISALALVKSHEFNSQEVANTLWAFATLRAHPAKELIVSLGNRAISIARDFNSQNISNVLWAYAVLAVPPGQRLIAAIEQRTIQIVDTFKSKEIATTLWACATLGVQPGVGVLDALTARANRISVEFKVHEGANLLWAYARVGVHPGMHLLRTFTERGLDKYRELYPQTVACTLWAYASLRAHPGTELLEGLVKKAARMADDYSTHDIADILWAYAYLGGRPLESLLSPLSDRVSVLRLHVSVQNACDMLWAYTMIGFWPKGDVLEDLCRVAIANEAAVVRDARALCQLHIFLIAFDASVPKSNFSTSVCDAVRNLRTTFGSVCMEAFSRTQLRSPVEQEICDALQKVGALVHRDAFNTKKLGYAIVCTVEKWSNDDSARRLFAIEMISDDDFVCSVWRDELIYSGYAAFKRRYFADLGYALVSILEEDWAALPSIQERQEYLRSSLLNASGNGDE